MPRPATASPTKPSPPSTCRTSNIMPTPTAAPGPRCAICSTRRWGSPDFSWPELRSSAMARWPKRIASVNRFATAFAAVLLLVQPVIAKPVEIALPDKADTVVVPDGSPLKFSKFDAEHQAVFTGNLTLSGTFYYGDNEYNDGTSVDLTLYFMPDAATVAHLPYLKTRGKAENLVVTDGAK